MRKILTFLFAALMSVGMWADPANSCGPNLTWDLTGGALTISGIGDMYDYDPGETPAPWESSRESITSVIISNRVTSIGVSAFWACTGLTSITIPSSVTSIGGNAFYGCTNITDVYCYPYSADLTWNDGNCDDFKSSKATSCHVYAGQLSDYQQKFNSTVNVNFVGDLPIIPNVDPQNPAVYYSTFFDSAKKYELPAGVEAYVATIGENVLNLTRIAVAGQVIPKDNAVILKSTVASFILPPSEADAVTFSATNNLQGTNGPIATPANCYVLSGEDGVVGFYRYAGEQVPSHKAFVVLSGSNQAPRRMRFVFEQENTTTGVENVQGDKVQSTKVIENGVLYIIKNGVRYNAQGQMVK